MAADRLPDPRQAHITSVAWCGVPTGDGYRGRCSCGWMGHATPVKAVALADCQAHEDANPVSAAASPAEPPTGRYYESIIKVNPTDDPARRASDIAEGIGYACALLMDEYGWTAAQIAAVLERVTDDVAVQEVRNGV